MYFILKNEHGIITNVNKSLYKVTIIIIIIITVRLMKLEFSRHIFKKSSNIKFHENYSGGSRVVPCGQMDGQADITWQS